MDNVTMVVSASEVQWMAYWSILAEAVKAWPSAGLGPLSQSGTNLPPWFLELAIEQLSPDTVTFHRLIRCEQGLGIRFGGVSL